MNPCRPLLAAALLSVAMLTLSLTGCQAKENPHEAILIEMIDALTQLDQALEGVTDAESARAAAPRFQAIADQIKALETRRAGLPDLTEAQETDLRERYEKPMEDAMTQIGGHVMKLTNQPEIVEILGPIFQDVQPPI